jgi:hypothetical protein
MFSRLTLSPVAFGNQGHSLASLIEIDSQEPAGCVHCRVSQAAQLANPASIVRPESPKVTGAGYANQVPPGLVGLLPQDQGGVSPPYQHCPSPMFQPQVTPEWRHPAPNSQGSLGSPVAHCPFKVAR